MSIHAPSSTPRTDEAEPRIETHRGGWVRADFAKKLEKELGEAHDYSLSLILKQRALEDLAAYWTAKVGSTSFTPTRDRCLEACAEELRAILNK